MAPAPAPVPGTPDRASNGQRIGGYLLDVLVVMPIALINLIPILGQVLWGIFGGCYWLLRDITGNSAGKMMLGLKVISKDGSQATASQRILRNAPLAAGMFLFVIPIVGVAIAPFISLPLVLIEIIMLLANGERLGDKLAGTMVVKKS